MEWLVKRIVVVAMTCLFFVVSGNAFAQDAPPEDRDALGVEGGGGESPATDLTAGELLEKGRALFTAGKYAEAEPLLEQFEQDYGALEEAKAAVEANKPLLALCKVQLKKFGEAGGLIDEVATMPGIDAKLFEELRFWRGICYMQAGEYAPAQHAFGSYYAKETNELLKRHEALILFGTCYTLLGQHDIAAEFFEAQVPKVREEPAGKEVAGRAVVMQMLALMESRDYDGAFALVLEQFPRLDEVTQIVSFQSLALELGSRFLEAGEFHKAIACLQRIWTRERLLAHQQEKLGELQQRLETLKLRPGREAAVFALEGMITRVEREIASFETIENFDSALRLRLAMAFQGLGRYRESALIIEDMLVNMEPDEVVESATLALIQSWMEIGRWPKAIEGADEYMARFGRTPLGHREPMVRFLKAQSLQNDYRVGEAGEEYGDVAAIYPDSDMAPKAQFMKGFCGLLQDDYGGALPVFVSFAEKYPEEAGLIEDAFYWEGMVYSFQKEYEKAREHMATYLERYGEGGKYFPEAEFRMAFCTHALADYVASIEELSAFIETYEGDPLTDEAKLLLGDALMGEGRIDEGIAVYKSIRPEATRFFEDGWFKIGKALRLMEDMPAMRAHFEEFIVSHSESNRLPEAVYWIGWTHRTEGDDEKTREIYWDTLREFGNDPERYAVEDILLAMPKLYPGDERKELVSALSDLQYEAERAQRDTLALRAVWAKARVQGLEFAEIGRGTMLEATKFLDAKLHHPLIIADCADAQREVGNERVAEELYVNLRKWHPRAIQKDRAYLGLGLLARARGEDKDAIRYLERFEEETVGSPRLGEVLLMKAELLADRGRMESAVEVFTQILEDERMSSETKARALMAYGKLLEADGQGDKAIAYFERIYVIYGKYSELVAAAYWARGQALEEMDLEREALEVYRELAGRDDLREFEEVGLAKGRIARLEPLVEPVSESKGEEVGS
ncbi:MAG: tetratricopeptide repeat protein [Verrucomicrobiota bacterium]